MNNRNTNTRSIVEAGLNAALVAVIMLMNAYVPVFSMVGTFLLPIPITILYIRHNYKVTISSIVVSAILVAILVSPMTALSSSILYGLTGFTLGYCIKTKKKVSATMGLLTLASAIGMAFSYYVYGYLLYKNGIVGFAQEMVTTLQESKNMAINMYKQMGVDTSQIEQLLKIFDMYTVDMLLMLFPAILLLGGFFSAYINYMFTKSILKRFRYEMPAMTPFSEVYLDNRLGALIIIIICIGVILSSRNMLIGQYIFASGSMVFNFVFTITGAAVVTYFLKNRYHVSKGLIVIIIVFGIMTQLGRIFFFLGILDMIFDFRKIDPNRILKRRESK